MYGLARTAILGDNDSANVGNTLALVSVAMVTPGANPCDVSTDAYPLVSKKMLLLTTLKLPTLLLAVTVQDNVVFESGGVVVYVLDVALAILAPFLFHRYV
jgi:hypothetical protein